jgi:Spy/CpxP family protein refolding chaperone
MKRIVRILAIVALALLLTGGMIFAQEYGEQAEDAELEAIQEVEIYQPMMEQGMMGGQLCDVEICRTKVSPMSEMMSGMMDCCMMGGGMMCEGMMGDHVCKKLHHFGGPGFYKEYGDELGLSDEQVKKLKSIWSEYKKEVIRKKADIKVAEIELGEILGQDVIDFGKAKGKITQIGSLNQAIRLGHLGSIENAQKVLTAEQLTKLKTLKKKSGKKTIKKCIMKKGG